MWPQGGLKRAKDNPAFVVERVDLNALVWIECRKRVGVNALHLSEFESTVLRRMAHPVIDEHECRHRLDDHGGARYDAGVVTPAGLQGGGGAAQVDGALGLED